MSIADRWLLPDGVEEILPPQARRLEQLRRQLLDLYQSWGYELVFPPLIEYLDSLLTGSGHDLNLQTFKIVDQLTGRTLGVRADITPQVARIDAHRLNREGPVRLCYAGSTLHAKPANLLASRNQIQIGVELYGHAGSASDLEVLNLMVHSLKTAGFHEQHLDLGHVDIYRQLAAVAGLNEELEAQLFEIYQRKAVKELDDFLNQHVDEPTYRAMLRALESLSGGIEVLGKARSELAGAPKPVIAAIDELQTIAEALQASHPEATLYFDLSELRGYNYHTGVVFSAYVPGQSQAVAQGGRYDHIGEVFGRARPATGFSTDLKLLLAAPQNGSETTQRIFAPASDEPTLNEIIAQLRQQGQCVIQALAGDSSTPQQLGCTHQLVQQKKQWQVQALA